MIRLTIKCSWIGLDCITVLFGLGSMNIQSMGLVLRSLNGLNVICRLRSSLRKKILSSMLLTRNRQGIECKIGCLDG